MGPMPYRTNWAGFWNLRALRRSIKHVAKWPGLPRPALTCALRIRVETLPINLLDGFLDELVATQGNSFFGMAEIQPMPGKALSTCRNCQRLKIRLAVIS